MNARKRRARRKRILIGAAAAVVIAAADSTLIYWNLPQTKLERRLDKASEYMAAMEYEEAQEVYEEAITLDEESVKAYRGLADDYAAQGRMEDALDTLKTGYEKTGEDVLMQNYAATILNAVVEELNAGTQDFSTMGRCLDVLELLPRDEDALELLTSCGQRILEDGEDNRIMLDGLDGSGTYSQYEAVMQRLLALAAQSPDVYLPVLSQYTVFKTSRVYVSLAHADSYRNILAQAQQLGVAEAGELIACLDKQAQISAYFAPMFTEFEAGNYSAAKSFIVSDEYTAIRDSFIEGTMDYWYGSSFIPVTKEAIVFQKGENGWVFSYVEDYRIANPTGTIRVMGEKMKDLGVQRTSVEYVPAFDADNYYPHTEYEIIYWDTMVSGIPTDNTNVVSRMNYYFAEKIYTKSGMEANVIYDWGGPNEKRQKE